MGVIIFTITVGGILIYQGITGKSLTEILGGPEKKDDKDTASDTFKSIIPPSKGGNWTAPAGGASSFKGSHARVLNYLAGVAQNQFHLTITATTNGGHVSDSLHFAGRAFDASGSKADMVAYSRFVMENFRAVIEELIFNDGGAGYAIDHGRAVNGSQVYSAVWANHRDHVHTGA